MHLSSERSEQFWWAGAIGIVALSTLMFFQAAVKTHIDTPIRGDARDYVGYAYNLKVHGVYSRSWPDVKKSSPTPDALRTPGYPFLLTFFVDADSKTFSLAEVLLLQAGIGVLTVIIYIFIVVFCPRDGPCPQA